MALKFGTDKILDISAKFPGVNLNNDKVQCSLQKISKIRSTKLKNLSLRMINGDLYSKERMFRFGMVDDPSCSRCGRTESTNHLIKECPAASRLWSIFGKIYKEVTGITFEPSMENIINCGINYNSLALTTIIAELNKTNIYYRVPAYTEGSVKKFITNLISTEKFSAETNKTKLDPTWRKWVRWFNQTDR
jgi:hypothetical protein